DEGLFAGGGAAEVVDGRVVGNFVNPGRKLELGAVATERAVNLDEDFLGQVEGRFVIADHAVNVGGNRTLVATHEFLEASFNATDGSGDEIAVGSGGQVT